MTGREAIDMLQDWSVKAATLRSNRPWCTFGLTDPTDRDKVAALFDRSDLTAEYATRFNEPEPVKKKPYSFLQVEIHLLYGFEKALQARHKTRLGAYRDDAAQKAYHTRRGLEKAFAKFEALQVRSEGEALTN